MNLQSIIHFMRSRIGRVCTSLVGLGVVTLLLMRTDFHSVQATLLRALPYFPLILGLEISVLACTMASLRILYGEDKHRIPFSALVRTGLLGYAVMGLVPAGRAAAEATRAALLARYTSGARAAAAATRLQAISLLANATICIPAAYAMYHVTGLSVPTTLILTNLGVTLAIGAVILIASRFSKIGDKLGRLIPNLKEFTAAFDDQLTNDWNAWGAFFWEFAGRIVQVVQNLVLVVAVGGALGLFPALCSEALHLIGVAGGEFVPAQLGATELTFKLSSYVLNLTPEDAMAIALIAHLAQLTWVVVGSLVPLFVSNSRHSER